MLAVMNAPRLAVAVTLTVAGLAVLAIVGANVGCDPLVIWVCNNRATGKSDATIWDADHYVNGVFDPCHCYDPCGPMPECPILVDAGPPCDAGSD
jgi:hypothetical protein